MRNVDPGADGNADGSSTSQPDVSDGAGTGPTETKRNKRRKAAGSRAGVSDRTDVSYGEASRGHTSSPNGADGPGQAKDQPPCCAQCGLPLDADEGSIEIAGKLYHNPDCSRWADHRPEIRSSDG
jgi:hypothetical protein